MSGATWLALLTACAGPALPDPTYYECDEDALGARDDHPSTARYQQVVEEALALGTPGVSVAVIDADGLWVGAGGAADLTQGVAARTCHSWHIASTTKMFAASALLRLAEQGRLDLDAPARWVLPVEVGEEVPNVREGVTTRQLLGHTSGIPDYLTLDYFLDAFNGSLEPRSAAQELESLHGRPAEFAPGGDYEYSNANYLLASLVLEEVTGQRAYDAVYEQVTLPLGLDGTRGRIDRPPALVRGYLDLHGNGVLIDFTDFTHAVMGGEGRLDGGLVGTPRDLAVMVRALAHGDLLGTDATAQMQAFRAYGPDDRDGIEDAYGLGMARIRTPYGPAIGHYGTVHPYQTLAFHLPTHDLTLAVTTNGYTGRVGEWLNSEAPWALLVEGSLP